MCKITKKNRIWQEPERENGSSTRGNVKFVERRAKSGLEFKGGEITFVNFAETEGNVKSE